MEPIKGSILKALGWFDTHVTPVIFLLIMTPIGTELAHTVLFTQKNKTKEKSIENMAKKCFIPFYYTLIFESLSHFEMGISSARDLLSISSSLNAESICSFVKMLSKFFIKTLRL